jgi:cytochrome P450
MTDLDIFQSRAYADGFPHDWFRELRATDPVSWHEESVSSEYPWMTEPGPGFWAVSRYDDVAHVSRHPELFSSYAGTTILAEPPEPAFSVQRQQMLNMDPPNHTRLRRIVNRAFTPQAVRALEERIDLHVAALLSDAAATDEVNVVEDIAAELPLLVLCEILGMPTDDRSLVLDWSNRLVGLGDPEYALDAADFKGMLNEMFSYADALSAAKVASPRDDLWSKVVHAEVDGEKLNRNELRMFFQLLTVAGNETTRNTISGGIVALAAHRDELARVQADPSMLPTLVEEILRWVSPVIRFRRTATQDTRVGETNIRAGDKVVVYYPSANRDEAVFAEPDRFDASRHPNEHLAFGIGPHFCLGASLARAQLRSLFGALINRHPNFELVGAPDRIESSFIDGIRSMRVRLGPAVSSIESNNITGAQP